MSKSLIKHQTELINLQNKPPNIIIPTPIPKHKKDVIKSTSLLNTKIITTKVI